MVIDETVKDLERYLGQKPVAGVARKSKLSSDKYLSIRGRLKTVETTTSRDLQDSEKFDRLQRTNEERYKKVEGTLKTLKESKSRSAVVARRDLDLIQVIFVLNVNPTSNRAELLSHYIICLIMRGYRTCFELVPRKIGGIFK